MNLDLDGQDACCYFSILIILDQIAIIHGKFRNKINLSPNIQVVFFTEIAVVL